MEIIIVVVRSTNEFVGVYKNLDAIPDIIMDNDEYYMILKEDI